MHTTGGYLVYAAMTHHFVFDYHDGDIFWCTADVGWVTGHSYIVYGPLANGATTLMFEGVPNYPTNSRFWEVIDKHQSTPSTPHRRHSRPDGRGRRAGGTHRAEMPSLLARWGNRSIRKPGNGIIGSFATAAARSWIPGGRPKPAAF